jgi:L,D-transpeptidase YbiS
MLDILITFKAKLQHLLTLQSTSLTFATTIKSYIFNIWKYLIYMVLTIAAFATLYWLLLIGPVNLAQNILINTELRTNHIADPQWMSENILSYQKQVNDEQKKSHKMLADFTPTKPYLIINTTTNTFELYKGAELIRSGKCSTGSYVKLQGKDQEWIFKTPKGFQTIKGKAKNPVWKKPDWAFVEEGMQVPSLNHQSRFEYGVLGNYALYMGDGYMIHGTLYQRLIGLPVTHGCIRLADDDLEAVYKTLAPNSKVFIL